METAGEVNSSIMKTTKLIEDHYPELSEYILEMNVTIPDTADPVISLESLNAYRESLQALLKKYLINSPGTLKEGT